MKNKNIPPVVITVGVEDFKITVPAKDGSGPASVLKIPYPTQISLKERPEEFNKFVIGVLKSITDYFK